MSYPENNRTAQMKVIKKTAGMYKKVLLIFAIICFGVSGTSVKKIVIENDTILTSSFYIPDTVMCVIEPGVTIKFNDYASFIVKGQLIARGEPDRMIVFTGNENDTVETGGYSWRGIEITGKKSRADLNHCVFKGAYRNTVWAADPVFDSCEFTGNHYALYCTKKAKAKIKNCKIYKNVYGLVADFATPLILDNSITENEIGLYIQMGSDAVVGRNFIKGNGKNIKTEKCFGENNSLLSPKYIWDFMQKLY